MYSIVNKVEVNMVDIRLLRLFIAIYEEKNLTLAAEKCHITQPSISAALKQLEELLGNDLFYEIKREFNHLTVPTSYILTQSVL